jgi:hypothetical protein
MNLLPFDLGTLSDVTVGIFCGLISGYTATPKIFPGKERLDTLSMSGEYCLEFCCFRPQSFGEIYR